MCTCGMGFDAQVAYDFQLDGKRGFPTYVKTALEDYLKFKPQEYKIDIDGRSFTEKAFVIAFGNAAQYGNNGFIAPHASMQDGKVDMTVISPFHVLEVPIMGLSLFFKKIDLNHCVNIYRATTFRIHRFEPGPMHIDGDPVDMPCDVEVKCHRAASRFSLLDLGRTTCRLQSQFGCLVQHELVGLVAVVAYLSVEYGIFYCIFDFAHWL